MDAVIVTAAGASMREVLYDLALPTFRRYAQRWGYDVHTEDLALDGDGTDMLAQQAKNYSTRPKVVGGQSASSVSKDVTMSRFPSYSQETSLW